MEGETDQYLNACVTVLPYDAKWSWTWTMIVLEFGNRHSIVVIR